MRTCGSLRMLLASFKFPFSQVGKVTKCHEWRKEATAKQDHNGIFYVDQRRSVSINLQNFLS